MDYRKILGIGKDELIFASAGIVALLFMSSLLFTHAQLEEETPEEIREADRTACQLAMIETNGTYHWNKSTQSCEKQVNRSDTVAR